MSVCVAFFHIQCICDSLACIHTCAMRAHGARRALGKILYFTKRVLTKLVGNILVFKIMAL